MRLHDYLLSPDSSAVSVGLHMIQHITPQELWAELIQAYGRSYITKCHVSTRQFFVNPRSWLVIRVYKELGIGKLMQYPYADVELGDALCIDMDSPNIEMYSYTCYWDFDRWNHVLSTSILAKPFDYVTDEDKLLIYTELLKYIHYETT